MCRAQHGFTKHSMPSSAPRTVYGGRRHGNTRTRDNRSEEHAKWQPQRAHEYHRPSSFSRNNLPMLHFFTPRRDGDGRFATLCLLQMHLACRPTARVGQGKNSSTTADSCNLNELGASHLAFALVRETRAFVYTLLRYFCSVIQVLTYQENCGNFTL